MAHIDYYFSTISPNCYLAGLRLEESARRHGATITYKPLDTTALFARTGGVVLKDRHPNRKAYRLQELRRQSLKTGLPLVLEPAFFPTNPAPSAYAIIAAQAQVLSGESAGDLGALVFAVLRACWAEQKDVADEAVIRACLEGAGFDGALASSGLLAGAETYAANLEWAVGAGVFGAPFYLTDGDERFWGQDRLADLDAHLAGDL